MITFKTNTRGEPVTESGQPVTCDGCSIRLASPPGEAQQQEVPADVALRVYGEDRARTLAEGGQPLTYVVCDRGVDCMTLAELADSLYEQTRCRDPRCTGDGTLARPCRDPLGQLN